MSMPPDVLSRLLQGGLLNYSQPNALDKGLMSGDPSMQFAAQLAANSNTPGNFIGILGRSLLGTQDAQQNNAINQMKLLGLGQDMRFQQTQQGLKTQIMQQALSDQDPSQQAPPGSTSPGTPSAAPPPMLQAPGYMGYNPANPGTAAQGLPAQNQAQPQDVASSLSAPSLQDIHSARVAGMNPRMAQAYDQFILNKDPLTASKEIEQQQYEQVQKQFAPRIAMLDNLIQSPSPAMFARANPQVMAAWPKLAQQLGFDPQKDFNDGNVRLALSYARNQIASSIGVPSTQAPTSLKTIQTGLGGSYQVNPVDNKISPGAPQQETAQFMTPNGGVKLMTKAQGMAQGLTPYNPSIYGAANMSDQAVQMAADYARSHGGNMPSGFSRSPGILAKVYDRMAKDAADSGDTMGAISARGYALKANGAALTQISKLETATNQYANTLDKNLDNLVTAYQKAGNAGSPLITKAYRIWQQKGTGDADTASMVTWLNAVQGEYAKLKSGSLGNAGASVSAMDDAKEVINKNMNQGGIEAVAAAMRAEKENRVAAIAEEKQRLMGNLSVGPNGQTPTANTAPPTNAAYPTSSNKATPPSRNTQGWMLHRDKDGKLAYVSPDGKAYQEVK